MREMDKIWSDLEDQQRLHRLTPMNPPDAGIAWMVHRWASGQRLEVVLRDSELSAGDFVRRCKQLVDLLDQVADATADPALRKSARSAVDAVMRGVVAADRLD
ncbi:hypothetical protein GCM10025872_16030 [Barrientosiimonas endolithica]|uniref:ATP-dependent RNA helicase Ski2/MTR4 C-terminal domain-containing protein n=1 Tax=Barrientosiimonas endolithica TaxID=1535208 RepID=A0ABM8HAJ5_9MICO|nr:hypothetical protein GCM10025872_16030 [Barrientosiimonas endolithica]